MVYGLHWVISAESSFKGRGISTLVEKKTFWFPLNQVGIFLGW